MNKVKFLVATLLGVLFVACSEEENLSQTGKTGFLISLAEDVKVESRSTPEEIGKPVASQFNLKITNQATGSELYNDSYTNQLIPASAGMYEIEATYGDNPVLALDAPYYKGTAEADLADGESKTVQVNCKVANALASVEFDNSGTNTFESQFVSYGVRVSVNTSVTTLPNDGKSAYYRAGSMPVFTFVGTLRNGGGVKEVPLENSNLSSPSTFAAGKHCQITLKLSDAAPGLRVEISKVEVDSFTINETIPLEWLPKPKVEAEGFDENNTLTFVETEQKQAALNLNLSSALQDMKFKFNFQDEQFAALDKEKTYQLSIAEDKAAIETALGITLPDVGDKPESIDLSNLLAKIQTNAGVTTTNTIEIDVKANNRWSSEDTEANRTYKIVCNKPEFSVSVKPENCWAWEFTVDEISVTKGDAEKIKSNLVYQYYDGTNWVDCSDGMTQKFAVDESRKNIYLEDEPKERTYQVRALYRGVIASAESTATLEEPWQLPNGDMEEWYWSQIHEDSWLNVFDSDTYTVYPWAENNSSFWNTNNDFTTRNRGTFSNIYNSFPAVSFIDESHSDNWAVELRNTGNGRGNTQPSNVLEMNKVAGELFIGDINIFTGGTDAIPSGDKYTITEGRTFSARPTALKFWYKYIPLNSDTWRVKLKLIDNEGNTIIEKEIESSETQSAWKEAIVTLDYQQSSFYAKCSKIYICFSSTITTGDNMQYEKSNCTIWLDNERTFEDVWHGSTLTIDDISLVYDK